MRTPHLVARVALGFIAAVLLLAHIGCAAQPSNPSFPLTYGDADKALDEMRAHPKRLTRPLVVIGGFMDPNVSPPLFAHRFRTLTGEGTIIAVSVGFCGSFEECRQKVIDAVDRACPTDDPSFTAEVDVVGASLGGLVGRYAAAPSRDSSHPRRLKVARLFTISSPHAGASLAEHVTLTQFHRDMKPGSAFLQYVAGADAAATYQLVPYVHLGDEIVGPTHAAPPGHNPYWLSNPPLLPGHGAAMIDPRIQADIARHLRGEAPFIRPPPAPLPQVVARDDQPSIKS